MTIRKTLGGDACLTSFTTPDPAPTVWVLDELALALAGASTLLTLAPVLEAPSVLLDAGEWIFFSLGTLLTTPDPPDAP